MMPDQLPSLGQELSEAQRGWLRCLEKGTGLEANPRSWSSREAPEELEGLVRRGIVRKAKNHPRDRHGMYILADYEERFAKRRAASVPEG